MCMSNQSNIKKIQIEASIQSDWGDLPIESINIAIGYPNSSGDIVWKQNGRALVNEDQDEPSNNTYPAIWRENNKNTIFIFNFQKITDFEKIKVRKTVNFKVGANIFINKVSKEYETTNYKISIDTENIISYLSIGPISLDLKDSDFQDQSSILCRIRHPKFGEKTYRVNKSTQEKDLFYRAWYEHTENTESIEYRVEVTVVGQSFGQPSIQWTSDWITKKGSGPLPIKIPTVPLDLEDTLNTYLP